MLTDLLLLSFGIVLLVVGGDVMVRGASATAARFGVSPLMIGLTVVAFGTSAPELAVNIVAALEGNTDLSFGNIFGSNMANIGLVIAISALIRPLSVHNVVIRREVPMMLLATLIAVVMGIDAWLDGAKSVFDRGDGVALLLLFSVFVYYTVGDVIGQRSHGEEPTDDKVSVPDVSAASAVALTVGGIAGLVVGGWLTVSGAEGIARGLGVSDAVIGLTLVAVGTSLPELAASIAATAKGHGDLAVGNVVGSNIFNLLVVLGTTATITPVQLPPGGLTDMFVVLGLSLMLWLTSMSQERRIIRAEATLLLGIYLGFMVGRVS